MNLRREKCTGTRAMRLEKCDQLLKGLHRQEILTHAFTGASHIHVYMASTCSAVKKVSYRLVSLCTVCDIFAAQVVAGAKLYCSLRESRMMFLLYRHIW